MTAYRKGHGARAAANLELINEFTSKYRARIARGVVKYGEFDATTDNRCLAHEAIEELLDTGSYFEFLEEKYPHLSTKIQPLRAKLILLYGEVKKLKELELAEGAK